MRIEGDNTSRALRTVSGVLAVNIIVISPLFCHNYQLSFAQDHGPENFSFEAVPAFVIQCPKSTTTGP